MKEIISLLLLFSIHEADAQNDSARIAPRSFNKRPVMQSERKVSADFYGMVPLKMGGAGAGFGIMSIPLSLGAADLRIGGDFYFTGLAYKHMSNVPLSAPVGSTGKVRLSENLVGLNLVARLSAPWYESMCPYIDGFIGFRQVNTAMTIKVEDNPREVMDRFNGYQYGLAGGFLIKLSSEAKLNVGVVYTQSRNQGRLYDIQSAAVSGDMLVMDKKTLPNNYFLFKVGFTVLLTNTSGSSSDSHCRNRSRGSTRMNETPRTPKSTPVRVKTGVRDRAVKY
jgi:hypothetical protein